MELRVDHRAPRRLAMVSMHTSPLARPGGGDAGGMNVYVLELSRALARVGIEVEIFTRAVDDTPALVDDVPGVRVHSVAAGPRRPLETADLLPYVDTFTAGIDALRPPGWFDGLHTHYWLSGLVGAKLADRWQLPLVHSMHTLARVTKRSWRDDPESVPPDAAPTPVSPLTHRERVDGEMSVVRRADRLVANTTDEAANLRELYGADPRQVVTVHPGVDLQTFTPPQRPRSEVRAHARHHLGLHDDARLLLFAGRIQPLKGPDVAIRAVAEALRADESLRDEVSLAVVGAPSGAGKADPNALPALAERLGVGDVVRFEPPADRHELARWFQAADLTLMPSRAESFGLVALESQASGTPVLGADVGGLRTVVQHQRTGVLVDGYDPETWSSALRDLLASPGRRAQLEAAGVDHATRFRWEHTAHQSVAVYGAAAAAHWQGVLRAMACEPRRASQCRAG
ncbi:MAG TPA: glycosyltransferase [Jiangellaceae bacterium]|nr:glycosyltransferase [Jiangellaceae bacterium]